VTIPRLKNFMKKSVLTGFAAILLFLVLIPFIWVLLTSLKYPSELYLAPPIWVPTRLYFKFYSNVFTEYPFARYLLNSLIVAGVTTLLNLAIGSSCAYALARLRFNGKKIILPVILLMSMFPAITTLSAMYMILQKLGFINSYYGLIFVYTSFTLPFAIWILTNYFKKIPKGLEEAASIDGANLPYIYLRIILPLAAPGVFTSALLTFINAWNEYLYALTFMTKPNMRTVPVGIALFPGLDEFPWGEIASACIIVTVPLVCLVLIFQRNIVSGLTAGSIKE
jgi:multiple sugar transport system permease protein